MATAEIVPVSDIKVGDVLVLPGAPKNVVTSIRQINLAAGQGTIDWPGFHILGQPYNLVRAGHEVVFRALPPDGG